MTVHELTCRTIDSPVGRLTLAGSGSTLLSLAFDGRQRRARDRCGHRVDESAFGEAVAQLEAYFAGELTEFRVDVNLAGTEFQRRVWAAVRRIPYGQTRSYAEIATQIGAPGASRAVGLAVGRNPVPIVVACHRVIGSAGGLTGYVGGLTSKRALLTLESR